MEVTVESQSDVLDGQPARREHGKYDRQELEQSGHPILYDEHGRYLVPPFPEGERPLTLAAGVRQLLMSGLLVPEDHALARRLSVRDIPPHVYR